MPRALLLVIALLQATGMIEVLRREVCEVECRSDGCDEDCTAGNDAPACPCHCPSMQTHVAPMIVASVIPVPIGPAPRVDADDDAHLSPDPREILHVPRRAV